MDQNCSSLASELQKQIINYEGRQIIQKIQINYLSIIKQSNLDQSKIMLYSTLYSGNSDLVSIKNLYSHCTSIQKFIQFTNNVVVQPQQCMYDGVDTLLKKYKIKAVQAVLNFCMRLINEANIFTQLHLIFIKHTLTLNCPSYGLPVVASEALPFKLDSQKHFQFLYYSFLVYYYLQMHEKGYKKLQELLNKLSVVENLKNITISHLFSYLLMSKLLGKTIPQNIKNFYMDLKKYLPSSQKIIFENIYCFIFDKKQQYSQQVIEKNLEKNEKKIFSQCYQDEGKQWRKLIESYILDSWQRFKQQQISGTKLNVPQTMFTINRFKNLAKYDCKEGVIYYNHEKITTNEINQLISKCFGLNQSIKKLKDDTMKIKMKPSYSFLSSRLGGFGRLYDNDDDDDDM